MRKFIIRIINLLLIVAALYNYNSVVCARAAADAAAKAEADAKNAEILAQNEELAASMRGDYIDGTYEGTDKGYAGNITVSVTVENGFISDIEVVDAASEDIAYMTMAEVIIDDIIDEQGTDVDTVTGATFSSTGIKNAVAKALEGAQ